MFLFDPLELRFDGLREPGSFGGNNAIAKPEVPEYYPEVLALPIARKPIFPGTMRSLLVQDPKVASAITRLKKRGQPYVGVFLTKDDKNERDALKDLNEVYDVGTFASIGQITSIPNGGISFLITPHRRIRATY